MELLQLLYFKTVAETENISKAAQIHMVPQPDMSVTIKKLEAELGAELFTRLANKLYLNDNGKRFYGYVKTALRSISDGRAAITDASAVSGEIKLLVLENRRITTECIINFKQMHPAVSFSVCHNLYNDMYTDFDLCISSIIPTSEKLHGEVLVRERIDIALTADHPLAQRKYLSPRELEQESFIFLPPNNSINKMATAYCLENGFVPKISFVCDDPFYIRKFISLGFGISFVPTISWRGQFDSGVRLIPLEGPGIIRESSVFSRTDRYIPECAKLFEKYLISKFAVLSDSDAG